MSKLTHKQVETWLFGERDEEMATAVADHLADCPQCQEMAQLVAELSAGEWHPYSKSPTEKAVIIADLQQQVRQKQMIKKQNKTMFPMNALVWSSAFIILILLTFGYFSMSNRENNTNLPAAVPPTETPMATPTLPPTATIPPPTSTATLMPEPIPFTEAIIQTDIGQFVITSVQLVDALPMAQPQSGNKMLTIALAGPNEEPLTPDVFSLEAFNQLESLRTVQTDTSPDAVFLCTMGGWLEADFVIGCEVPASATEFTFIWSGNAPITLFVDTIESEPLLTLPAGSGTEVEPPATAQPMPLNPLGNLVTEPVMMADIDCDNTIETVSITRPVLGDGVEVLAPYQLQVEDPDENITTRMTMAYWLDVTEPPYPRYYDVQAFEIDDCGRMAFAFTNQPLSVGNEWGSLFIWDGINLHDWQSNAYILNIEKGETTATMTTWQVDIQRSNLNEDTCLVIEMQYAINVDSLPMELISFEEGMAGCNPNG